MSCRVECRAKWNVGFGYARNKHLSFGDGVYLSVGGGGVASGISEYHSVTVNDIRNNDDDDPQPVGQSAIPGLNRSGLTMIIVPAALEHPRRWTVRSSRSEM